jgi:AbrB family looped-hinge helix DNA binding protein
LIIIAKGMDVNYFEVTVVSTRGQIVIPLTFRKRLGIRPGTKLIVLSDGHSALRG